ncbi:bile acid:sodium symporter, partial [Mycobacterium tuberculosis]|nr:bile acid:sodium symporter [Mycobacterium tuberculosis]
MLRLRPDNFTLAIFGAVILASFLPVSGQAADVLDIVVNVAIALLFFMHGAKISRQAALAGLTHWRLHLLILASTFVLFPAIGLGLGAVGLPLPPELMVGMLYMTLLPSTVQSSIAFTSIARGNVAAAVCAASASNLFGIFLTPALVSLTLH